MGPEETIRELCEAAEEITCNLDPASSGCTGIRDCSTCPLIRLARAAREARKLLEPAVATSIAV